MLKKLRTLLASLRGTPHGAANRRPRRGFIQRLEWLEERAVPTIFMVSTTLDTVAADGKLSLREAISAANAHPGPDTIVVPAGVYRLALTGADNNNAAGDLDVTGSTPFLGAGTGNTVIDGQQLDRVFDVLGSAPHSIGVTFQGLTVRNGLADAGGGIRVGNADLTVQDCVITGNHTAGEGGGISNAALQGTGNVTLVRTTVSGNFAGGDGGGNFAGTVALTKSTVSGNHATTGNGGGIDAGTATLTNSTVSGNSAKLEGGGIWASGVTLLNVTITDNSAHTGGGVFLAPGGTSSVRNTIIAGNLVDFTGTGPDVSGTFASGGHNLIGDGTGATGFANGANGDQVGTAADPIDPRLAPLANNGGPTQTHALRAGSPAIDRGDNTGAPATDQRGVGRPRDGDGNGTRVVDIGAFEK